jgi:hypothetical protein
VRMVGDVDGTAVSFTQHALRLHRHTHSMTVDALGTLQWLDVIK